VTADVFEGLSAAQAEAVSTPAAPLAVVAGPGTGKTRVLTRRIARRCRTGDAEPGHVLVLTFSRRAAAELLDRLAALGLPAGPRQGGVTAGTFHAVAWAGLNHHHADRGLRPPVLLTRPRPHLRAALSTLLGRDPAPEQLTALADELGWARAQGGTATTYGALVARTGRRAPLAQGLVSAAWEAYDRAKATHGAVDFDDLLTSVAGLLEQDAGARAVARWRHRHVFVDEYQDLNPAHLRLLRAWVGPRPDLCLVGDPDQAVYGFNGACPDLFDRLDEDWPGVRVVALEQDFRASPELVAVSDAVRPARAGVRRTSGRPPGPIPAMTGFADEEAEAAAIAGAVLARHGPGRGWTQMAVLARTNLRLRVIADAFTAAGIPWRLRDARPLADRPSVRGWLAAMPRRSAAADLDEVLEGRPDGPDRDAVATALVEYRAAAPAGTVAGFRAWLDATGATGEEGDGVGVDLATFHRAKGLEWDSVWVAGVEDGTVPLFTAGSAAALAEEQRLLYVATSRAAVELHLSWVGPAPSRWLASIEATTAALAAAPTPTEQGRRLSTLRAAIDTQPAAVRRRRAALVAWRARRARAARVPPSVILADRDLIVLAESDATTAEDLATVAPGAGWRLRAWAAELLPALSGHGGP
jgi:DNA helicase-2/ATP-dependent DNA helicase PcrA